MMENELLELVKFLNSGLLWLYCIIVFVVFYAIISLLTWNIKKPLMFLGIPTIIVGVLLIIIRFSASLLLPNDSFQTIFNSAVRPLLIIGIVCIIVGIAMIILYKVLKKIKAKKAKELKTEG